MEDQKEKELAKGIRYHFLNVKLKELRDLEQGLPAVEKPSLVLDHWKIIAVAAGILIVISFVFLSSRTPTPLQLYAANFQPYPNAFEPTQRDGNVSRDKRATAFAAYEQKNYEVAATLFKELVAEKNEPEILLLLGNANMILDRDDEAMNNFQSLINEFDALDEQGKWYLSLCYVKSGEVDEAKKILKDIDSEQAHKLLNKLK